LFLFKPVIIEAPHHAYGSGCASLRSRPRCAGLAAMTCALACALAGCGGTTQLGSLFGKDKGTAS
jgi:hypothetical protein